VNARTILLLSGFLAMPLSGADSVRQPAWSLTTEERLAIRLDAAHMRQREIARSESQRGVKAAEPVVPRYETYVIDGCRDPELFLPTELFDALLLRLAQSDGAFASERDAIERISARYREAKRAKADPDELCRLRALALAMARAEFGAAAFDRFLYEAVAPSLSMSFRRSEDAAERLRDQEQGCRRH